MENLESKRMFFGIETIAPWPSSFPEGKLLEEKDRHITLAFIGNADVASLKEALCFFPSPSFKIGIVGKFIKPLFLPEKKPRLVAYEPVWLEDTQELMTYQKTVSSWLKEHRFFPDNRHPFNPHVTVCRHPASINEWKKVFAPLPLFLGDIHLYESLGNSRYASLWSYPLLAPFVEKEHTADIAFDIRGKTLTALYHHASIALCFTFPPLLNYLLPPNSFCGIEDVIIKLNEIVAYADQEIGIPFKAVSFHGNLTQKEDLFYWEMFIDV